MQETAVVVDNVANNATVAPAGDMWGMLLFYLVIFGALYLFMVRPNKKRMAQYQKMLNELAVGDRVMAAGIYGKIKKINDTTIEVEVAKGVVLEFNKNAVASVEK